MHHFAVVRFSGSPHHDIAKGRLQRQSPPALDWNEHASVHVDGALRPVNSSHHSDHAMQRVLEPNRLPNDGTLTELLRDIVPDRTEVLRRVERRHEPSFPVLQAPQLAEVVGCAERRFWEFFTAHIRNPNTRLAYLAAVRRFAVWCERWDLALDQVEPMVVAAYIEQLSGALAPASVKQHLAALRMLFDWLVVGQVLPFNPASSVRGPKHVVKTGKTPVLSAKETRTLLDGIDISTLVGLRDRALLGVLVYSFARVSAAVSLRVADYYTQGPRSFFRLHEKGGRYNVVPAHHTAQAYVDAYLEAAGIGEDRRGPLFRSCEPGRRDALQDGAMSRLSALKMIKRRARKSGLPAEICAHSFRGTGITEYLRNGGDLKVAARIAGHESTRTTQLYNRLNEEISLDEIERIHI